VQSSLAQRRLNAASAAAGRKTGTAAFSRITVRENKRESKESYAKQGRKARRQDSIYPNAGGGGKKKAGKKRGRAENRGRGLRGKKRGVTAFLQADEMSRNSRTRQVVLDASNPSEKEGKALGREQRDSEERETRRKKKKKITETPSKSNGMSELAIK